MAAHATSSSIPCRISVAGVTHVGRIRQRNEDAFIIEDLDVHARGASLDRPVGDGRGVLLVVADGMGGVNGGNVASLMASEAVADTLEERQSCADRVLAAAIKHANEAVRTAADELELPGMGTTLTVAHVCGLDTRIAHVGDSRAYLARRGNLFQLTRDDTVVQAAVDAGALSPEEAKVSPLRHVLAEAVGTQTGIRPDLTHVLLAPGDRLLLCTDGLAELEDDEILRTIERATSASEAAERLVEAANERGGRDNVTVVVAMIEGAGSETRRAAPPDPAAW